MHNATLATVSRCGMVWFSEDVLTTEMIFHNFMAKLKNISLEEEDDKDATWEDKGKTEAGVSPTLQVKNTNSSQCFSFSMLIG